jgi:hypothetical protein
MLLNHALLAFALSAFPLLVQATSLVCNKKYRLYPVDARPSYTLEIVQEGLLNYVELQADIKQNIVDHWFRT